MPALLPRMTRPMTAMLRFTCIVLLLTITPRAPESRAQITPPLQPSTEHSFVPSRDDRALRDQELADNIRTNLPGTSLANVRSIVVLTQSSFSGGVIDELLALGSRVSVGFAANRQE